MPPNVKETASDSVAQRKFRCTVVQLFRLKKVANFHSAAEPDVRDRLRVTAAAAAQNFFPIDVARAAGEAGVRRNITAEIHATSLQISFAGQVSDWVTTIGTERGGAADCSLMAIIALVAFFPALPPRSGLEKFSGISYLSSAKRKLERFLFAMSCATMMTIVMCPCAGIC